MSFEKLGVFKPLLDAITEIGYSKPTTIQTRAIPLVLQKKDIFATAQTGTGKTAAFALPITDTAAFEKTCRGQRGACDYSLTHA